MWGTPATLVTLPRRMASAKHGSTTDAVVRTTPAPAGTWYMLPLNPAAGVAGAAGTILFFYASHQGFLAVTAVLTSLYPAATIVLARTVLGERLTPLRLAGLGLAGVCVSLIAVGGAG